MSTSAPSHDLAQRARAVSLQLSAWPSVTGTPDEAAFSHKLAGLLREIPYFAANPNDLLVAPIPGDPLGRSNVFALVRGAGRAAVMLTGHFDTVPVDDYGPLKSLAGEAESLRPRLIESLKASGLDPHALADFESGAFLPGRGLLDMKAGVGAGIAVLEAFAANDQRRGNVLLVATPDEEDRSAGMRAAADLLPNFLAERGLDVRLDINLDAICDDGDGASGRVVAFGCIGKLLLSALVVGLESHAAYPLAGVNAAYLAAEITAEMEFAPELGEDAGGELAAPPTVLGLRDLKTQYNVTIPGAVWTYWNVLIHRRTAAEVMTVAKTLIRRALDRAATRMAERAASLKVAVAPTPAWRDIPILTYAELRETAERRDAAFRTRFDALGAELSRSNLDFPTRSRHLIEETWASSGLQGPAVILAYGSMPYPAVAWRPEDTDLRRAVERATQATAQAHGVSIGAIEYFPAIADMSFVGPVDATDLAEAARQTPIWGSSIRWDLKSGATPAIPIVNIGPWGRDYHHWLERLHAPYAFEVLPALVQSVVAEVLAEA